MGAAAFRVPPELARQAEVLQAAPVR